MSIIKKILILSVLIILLSISFVSAEDVTIDNSTTIQDAVDNANTSDTIYLNPGIYKQSGIKIDKDLTLQGLGDASEIVIDAEQKDSIILVDSISKITVKNITFINAFSDSNGGAIKVTNGGHLVVDHCDFKNNSVDNSMGGAIAVYGHYYVNPSKSNWGSLTITNSNFTNNYAGVDGGATTTYLSVAHISNSNFINNSAGRDCGGVNTRGTDITFIDNCTFIGNYAEEAGAAIKNYLSEMTITNCYIYNNTAKIIAGAIRNCGPLTMTHSIVINNTAGRIASILEVYLEEPNLIPLTKFNYNEFIGNYAPKESIAHIYDMGTVAHDFNYNYWDITPNTSEWNASFICEACPNPNIWLELVNETIIASNMTRGYNSAYDFNAIFLDKYGIGLINKEVQFNVNGKNHTVITDENGLGKLTLKLPVGSYEITSINPATGEEVTSNVKIVSRITQNNDLTKDYLDSKTFTAKIIGDDGNAVGSGVKVKVTLNGVTSTLKTNSKGIITKTISLTSGKYTIKVNYKGYTASNKITVKNILKSKNVAVKVKKPITVKATLKYSNGKVLKNKKVTFKFKGKTYSAITNSKGIAKISIKNNYKVGKYNIYIKYVDQQIKQTVKIKK